MTDPERARRLADLRERLRQLEQGGGVAGRAPLPFGLPPVDTALGGGLPLGCLHEVAAAEGDAAAAGFCAALLGRLAADGRPVLWIGDGPYAPGALAFGLDPGRMILVSASRPADRLWAMEEGLRCTALSAVLCELERLGMAAGRRLHLAAEASGVTGLLLCRPPRTSGSGAKPEPGRSPDKPPPSAAVTRWRVAAAPSVEDGPPEGLPRRPRWHVELWRCRGGRTGCWLVEWRDETGDLALAAALRDGPAAPLDAGGGGQRTGAAQAVALGAALFGSG